jgi:hypothetical protein
MPKRDSRFKSITVPARLKPGDPEETFDKIERLAREKGTTNAAFLKAMVDEFEDIATLPLPRLGVKPIEVKWPKKAWEAGDPFRDIFRDIGVLFYKSIAWIRSEHYPQRAGRPQWPFELQNRVAKDPKFEFEKILILSPKAQDKLEVWKWVFFWLSRKSEYKENVGIYVVSEDQVKKVFEEYAPNNLKRLGEMYDMGIYGEKAIGLLEVDTESRPGHYLWKLPSEDPSEDWTMKDSQECIVMFDTLKNRHLNESEVEKGLSPVLKGLARELTKHRT